MRTDYIVQEKLNLVLASLTPGNRLVVRTMLHTGLRVSDVLELRTKDIKPRTMVTERKTGKRRLVGLPAELRHDILDAAGGSEWAFPSPRDPGKHRTRQAVWKDIKRAQRAFRLRANLGTHTMRKEYAVALMNKYHDIERVQRALMHSNAATTIIYALADQLTKADARSRRKRKS